MSRKIKKAFINELLTGSLKPFLEYVQIDDTLNVELRGDRVMVYYRGGAILTIEQDTNNLEGLVEEYHKGITFISPSIINIEQYIPKAKHIIDGYINTKRNHLGDLFIDEMLKEEKLGKLARGDLKARKEYKPVYVPVDFYEGEKKYL